MKFWTYFDVTWLYIERQILDAITNFNINDTFK